MLTTLFTWDLFANNVTLTIGFVHVVLTQIVT